MQKHKKTKKQLGNPLLAAAATKAAPVIINTGGKILKYAAIGIGGLVVFGVAKKAFHSAQAKKYLNEAGTDLNVQTAIKIFDEIPDEYTEKVRWYNPVSWINGIWNEAKGLVTSIDSEKVIALAGKITDYDKVQKAFKAIYQLDITTVLQAAMKPEDYLLFIKAAKRDNTPYESSDATVSGTFVIPKKQTQVYRRRFITDTKSPVGYKIGFEIIIVDALTYLGTATGKKYYIAELKKNFYETALKSNKHSYNIYIAMDEAKMLTATEYTNKKPILKSVKIRLLSTEIFNV